MNWGLFWAAAQVFMVLVNIANDWILHWRRRVRERAILGDFEAQFATVRATLGDSGDLGGTDFRSAAGNSGRPVTRADASSTPLGNADPVMRSGIGSALSMDNALEQTGLHAGSISQGGYEMTTFSTSSEPGEGSRMGLSNPPHESPAV